MAGIRSPQPIYPWTALETPAISIPMLVGHALPMGPQLTAEHGSEARVPSTAARLYTSSAIKRSDSQGPCPNEVREVLP